MKTILNITTSSPVTSFMTECTLFGEKFKIVRIGCGFNEKLIEKIIISKRHEYDYIALSGVPKSIVVEGKVITHPFSKKLLAHTEGISLTTGQQFREVYYPWTLKKYILENKAALLGKRISFYSGSLQKDLVTFFSENNFNLSLADPYFMLGIPLALESEEGLDRFFKFLKPFIFFKRLDDYNVRDFSSSFLQKTDSLRRFGEGDIFIVNNSQMELISFNDLKGKSVIVDYLSPTLKNKLRSHGVKHIVTCMPEAFKSLGVDFAVLEAVLRLLQEDKNASITGDDVLEWIEKYELYPEIESFGELQEKTKKFAFILHPLIKEDYLRYPPLRPFRFLAPSLISTLIERLSVFMKGRYYGKITGISSQSGANSVEGIIYTVMETSKMLKKSEPEAVYKKLVKLARQAKDEGAEIVGLGAYTKIVGDAGITVAKFSPIPVTTGNSLSAAATLWAASYVTSKMDFVPLSEDKIYQGTAMVVGATGSIGKVCAKLLAMKWQEVILVAPKAHKLLELKEEVQRIAPSCVVKISTTADLYSMISDLIITSTSAVGEKILDISKVKAGAVICDVSRPYDISKVDAMRRPDVMVVSSGEVELPGVDLKVSCDLGLHGKTVYACLAETAILALEGKFENFTLSRNINYKKVIEIDQMARKHGVRLSAIMSHDLEVTDDEIFLCREHALKARRVKIGTED